MATSPSDRRDRRRPSPDGQPSPEELAAIVAAVMGTWPVPSAPAAAQPAARPGWRFSGRWWAAGDDMRRQGGPRRPGRTG